MRRDQEGFAVCSQEELRDMFTASTTVTFDDKTRNIVHMVVPFNPGIRYSNQHFYGEITQD